MTGPTRFKKFRHVDPLLFMSAAGLYVMGTIMVFSSSSLVAVERFGDPAYYLKRHLLYTCVGLVALMLMFLLNIRGLRKLALPALAAISALLLLTSISSLGVQAKNATRWLSLGGFTLQPSEFAKPILILYVAAYLSKKKDHIREFMKGMVPLLGTLGITLLLILKQPDFGTCVAIALTVFLMLFVGRATLWHLAALCLTGVLGGYALIQGAAYRRARLLAFLDPWNDPKGKGFQIIQSFVAFEKGGFSGQGLGDGTQKLLYLPEAHTDFIFSVIAEELGFIGTVLVIFLFGCLVVQGLKLSLRIREPFAAQLAFGLTAMIGIQAILNMAVVMGMIPTKGLTLPLVSYGGSSLVTTLASLGILFSLSSTVSMSTRMARRVD